MTVLKMRREKCRRSIRSIATELNLSFSALAKIEGRLKPAPLAYAFAIADFFALEAWELFGSDGFALRIQDVENWNEEVQL